MSDLRTWHVLGLAAFAVIMAGAMLGLARMHRAATGVLLAGLALLAATTWYVERAQEGSGAESDRPQ